MSEIEKKPWAIVGRTILSVSIAQDRESISFATNAGPIIFMAKGDCCSQSWIEEFDCEGIVGSMVTAIKQVELPEPPSSNNLMKTRYPEFQQKSDQAYFFELVTTSGSFTIEMRNSSNGYYGGWLKEEAG